MWRFYSVCFIINGWASDIYDSYHRLNICPFILAINRMTSVFPVCQLWTVSSFVLFFGSTYIIRDFLSKKPCLTSTLSVRHAFPGIIVCRIRDTANDRRFMRLNFGEYPLDVCTLQLYLWGGRVREAVTTLQLSATREQPRYSIDLTARENWVKQLLRKQTYSYTRIILALEMSCQHSFTVIYTLRYTC